MRASAAPPRRILRMAILPYLRSTEHRSPTNNPSIHPWSHDMFCPRYTTFTIHHLLVLQVLIFQSVGSNFQSKKSTGHLLFNILVHLHPAHHLPSPPPRYQTLFRWHHVFRPPPPNISIPFYQVTLAVGSSTISCVLRVRAEEAAGFGHSRRWSDGTARIEGRREGRGGGRGGVV